MLARRPFFPPLSRRAGLASRSSAEAAAGIPITVRRPASLGRVGRSACASGDGAAWTDGIASVGLPIGSGGAAAGLTGTPGSAPTSV